MEHDPEILWKTLLLRNKGLAYSRIGAQTGKVPVSVVRARFKEALEFFDPEDISSLIANNRVNMPKKYRCNIS